jgi:hypothetical protein
MKVSIGCKNQPMEYYSPSFVLDFYSSSYSLVGNVEMDVIHQLRGETTGVYIGLPAMYVTDDSRAECPRKFHQLCV